jgi:hypothetical protein
MGLVMAGLLALQSGGCPDQSPPPSVGHDPNQPGVPDPAPHTSPSTAPVRLKFHVENKTAVVVTWNAGQGNKFIDPLRPPGDTWYASAPKGSQVYLGAVLFHQDQPGLIVVKVTNADNGKLICTDTNWQNERSGASCQNKAK